MDDIVIFMQRIKQGCLVGLCIFIIIMVAKNCFFSDPLESKISAEDIEDCKSACNSDDYENAHMYLTKILNEYEKFSTWDRCVSRDQVIATTGYVYEKEISFLLSQDDEKYHQRVILLLKEFPIYGMRVSEGGNARDYINEFNEYISWCAKYNEICNHALDVAIMTNNNDVASKVVLLFKRMPSIRGDEAEYSDDPQTEAQKKYQSAVDQGFLKLEE